MKPNYKSISEGINFIYVQCSTLLIVVGRIFRLQELFQIKIWRREKRFVMKLARTIKQRVGPGWGSQPLVVHARNYTRARVTMVTRCDDGPELYNVAAQRGARSTNISPYVTFGPHVLSQHSAVLADRSLSSVARNFCSIYLPLFTLHAIMKVMTCFLCNRFHDYISWMCAWIHNKHSYVLFKRC